MAAFVLPPVGDLLGGSALAVPVALALGAAAAYLYARVTGVRSFATLIGAAPVVVLVLFLIVSPVRGLLFPSDAVGTGYNTGGQPHPTLAPDGKLLMWTSNMGGSGRYDTFIARVPTR